MRCAYCNGPCDDRPVRYEAICWTCHPLAQAARTKGIRRILTAYERGRKNVDEEGYEQRMSDRAHAREKKRATDERARWEANRPPAFDGGSYEGRVHIHGTCVACWCGRETSGITTVAFPDDWPEGSLDDPCWCCGKLVKDWGNGEQMREVKEHIPGCPAYEPRSDEVEARE